MAAGPPPSDVVRDNVQNICALSPMQEGLLFHALADPRSTAYFQQLSYRLTGALDLAAFEASWNELVRRHDVLRTVFVHAAAEQPLQVVLRERRLEVTVRDLSDLDAATQAAMVHRFKEADRARPFDLARDLLLRIAVLRLGHSTHEVVFSHHHIVMDGWSLAVLQAELAEIYAALREGRRPALPPPVPYRRHIAWLEKADGDAAQRFWGTYLAGSTTVARVPERRGRPAAAGTAVTCHAFVLDAAMTAALAERATALRATPSAVLHALWGVLLGRYNATGDVVFGSLVSGRSAELAGVERAVGLFINTVPVRVRISADTTLATLVGAVQRDTLARAPHEYHPLARIQAESALGRDLLGTVIAVENYPVDARLASAFGAGRLGVTVEAVETFDHTHWDFVVQFLPGASLRVRIVYDARRVHDEQARAVEGHFRRLVEALLRDPLAPVAAVDILTPGERLRALDARTLPILGQSATLVGLFEAQARATPEAVAVIEPGGRTLTYGELRDRARRMGARLRALGVGPDVFVAVCLERSAAMVPAILGVLEAGGAYVPLDPGYPRERLAFMLEDAHVAAVITDHALRERLPATVPAIVWSDEDTDADEDALPVALHPDHAAYAIYTSGSTGRPKGVVVTHANVVRLFAATAGTFGFGADDVWTLFHSYAFDFSVWELWGALLHGGRVVVVPHWTSRTPEAFRALLADERVTVLNQTPSAFRQLVAADAEAAPDDLALRWIVFGGEALDLASLRPWIARHGDRRPRLVNMYGITETTVHVTFRAIDASDVEREASVIGAPLADLETYVLDERLAPVPVGVTGELYVGGAGLARGYLDRPGLTAERFVAHPHADRPGARLYRTGDLARRTWDGELEYIGRADHQVKIRGFRIELGEIEARLAEHPAVRDAVVLARQDPSPRLVAYVVPWSGETLDAGALRAFLAARLPEYMVPAAFVPLAALPLNENGKLDRGALPAPAAVAVPRESAHVAPRTPIEQTLAEVWAAVLGVEAVGVDDDYFALGGDSITAIRIAAGLRRHGLALEIRQLLRFPTIAALAPHVTAADARAGDARPDGAVLLTPIQARFLAEHTVDPAHFNQAVRLRARTLDAEALHAALAALLDHHDAFRLGFVAGDGGWRQMLAPGAARSPLDIVDLRGRADWRDAVVAHADRMQRSFDLAVPPLVRAALYRTDDGDDLVLVAHHLVVDGVSWRILLEDLETAYDQALAGEPPRLPPKTHSYQRWAQALHDARGRPDLVREAAYWRDVLAHPAGDLPSDRGAAKSRYGDARVTSRRLSPDDTDRLVTRANAAYRTTTEELLLTALARALDRWHGRDTTLIALESHGREEIAPGLDVTRTVGWFTAIFPFALHAPRERDLGYQVKWIKESVRRIPRKGIGHGLLASLGPGALDAPPHRPEIAVNYLGVFGHVPAGRFRLTTEPAGAAVSPRAERPFAIELAGAVVDGALELAAAYDAGRFGETTIARLMDDLVKELDAVARHCAERRGQDLTPADLTYSDLTLDELDELFS